MTNVKQRFLINQMLVLAGHKRADKKVEKKLK